MNPWPWLAMTIIGMIGSIAAMPPAVEDLEKLVAMNERGETPTRRHRLMASRWGFLGLIFSISAVVGALGLGVYLAR